MPSRLTRSVFGVLLLASVACGSGGAPTGASSPQPLAAPSPLTAAPLGGGVHVTWKDIAGEDSYSLERRVAGDTFRVIAAEIPFDTTAYHDADVAPGGTYTYRVRARAGERTSPYSNEATAMLAGGATPPASQPSPSMSTTRTPQPDAGTGINSKPADAAAQPMPRDGGADTAVAAKDSPPAKQDAPAPATTVSFRRDIVPVLLKSCGASTNGCHTREAYLAWSNMDCRGWLSLEDAALGSRAYGGMSDGKPTGCPDRTLYERLTQLDAWMCSPRKRYIRAGSLAGSQLYQVMAGDPTGGGTCEKSPGVPLGRMPPLPLPALDAETTKKVADWIMAGAPNN